MSDRNYLGVSDTAKLVRQALKESFPGIKFTVRSDSYASGASIRIRWPDGPTQTQVKAVIAPFEGSYFDGMIDYKGSRYALLDGQPTRFGADFIFADRDCSDELVERSIDALCRKYSIAERPTAAQKRNGELYNMFPCGGDFSQNNSWQSMILQDLSKRTRVVVRQSATLARVQPAGDDGYGRGTVGTGDGCERGYAGLR